MNYLIAAYTAIWILFFFYLLTLRIRQTNLQKTIDGLRKQIEKH